MVKGDAVVRGCCGDAVRAWLVMKMVVDAIVDGWWKGRGLSRFGKVEVRLCEGKPFLLLAFFSASNVSPFLLCSQL